MPKLSCKVEVLVKHACQTTGEGPHYDPKRNELLYVDISNGMVNRVSLQSGEVEQVHVDGGPVSLVVPCESGDQEYIVSVGLKLCKLNWSTKKVTDLVEAENVGTQDRFNDGKCDPRGRLWAGTMGFEKAPADPEIDTGRLYTLVDGVISEQDRPFSISNGLAWTADRKTMYFIDSIPRCVFKYQYDIETGKISNQEKFVDFTQWPLEDSGYPDGMTIDKNDDLWVAAYWGGKIIKFCGKTGERLGHVTIPAKRTTSCCFGGPDHSDLFVTCGKLGWTEEEFQTKDPLAGSVFKVSSLGVEGEPAFNYKG